VWLKFVVTNPPRLVFEFVALDVLKYNVYEVALVIDSHLTSSCETETAVTEAITGEFGAILSVLFDATRENPLDPPALTALTQKKSIVFEGTGLAITFVTFWPAPTLPMIRFVSLDGPP
jgi:hypothetical protein